MQIGLGLDCGADRVDHAMGEVRVERVSGQQAFGFMGAAWMTLATELLVCGLSLRVILGALELPLPPSGRVGRTVLAAATLAGSLIGLRLAGAPLAVLVLAACVLYPALLFGLRALDLSDLRVLVGRGTPA